MSKNKDELSFEEYLDTQLNIKYMSESDTNELILKARTGDKSATDKLCRYHGKFVRKMAREFTRDNISFDDLFQEGMIGLTDGIQAYDETRDNKFMTFAYYHIYKRMMDFTSKNTKNIRIPRHMYELTSKYKKMVNLMEDGTLSDMSELDQANYLGCDIDKLEDIKKAAMQEVSIYMKNDETEGSGLIDTFEAPAEYQPELIIEADWLKEQLLNMVAGLTEKEAMIIKLKFGLIDGIERKDTEIAEKLGVTKQAVNSLYQRGLNKLRKYCKNNRLDLSDLLY